MHSFGVPSLVADISGCYPEAGGPKRGTSALRPRAPESILARVDQEQIRARVEEILARRERGGKLTHQEEKILAYAHYAAREQRTVFVVPREADDTK